MAKFRVEIDRNMCQGFGACVELCPAAFDLSEDDGKSRLTQGVQRADRDSIEVDELACYGQAEASCPFRAITVTRLEEVF
jgi:ferredoxin